MRGYCGEYCWKRGPASLVWTGHPSGVFSRRNFQETFETKYEKSPWTRVIWQQWLPQKISLFMWRLIQNGLPVDGNIKRVCVEMASKCLCCGKCEETIAHLFFKGEWAQKIWGNWLVCLVAGSLYRRMPL